MAIAHLKVCYSEKGSLLQMLLYLGLHSIHKEDTRSTAPASVANFLLTCALPSGQEQLRQSEVIRQWFSNSATKMFLD